MARSSRTGRGGRTLPARLKTARGRKISSSRWLERQLNDPYVAAAKRDGFRARAAYKLIGIDDAHHFLMPGARVVDLGAAPGSWSQVAASRVRAVGGEGQVIAVDSAEIEPLAGVSALQLDFEDEGAPEAIRAQLEGGAADVLLSDMAPGTTGHKRTDHLRIMALTELALGFACEVLGPGGTFLAKVWQGGTEHELLRDMKRHFTSVRHVKPKASRPDSAELYVLAKGFRGRDKA